MEKSIKTILAILFLLCLLDVPYGYFQFVRFAALVGFALLAYSSYQQDKQIEVGAYIALAILFQPIFKIALGRTLWNVIDVVVAIGLLISIFIKRK